MEYQSLNRRITLTLISLSLCMNSCKEDNSISNKNSIDVITTINVTAFTATVSGTITGLSYEELNNGRCGVLYTESINDAQILFNSWKDGINNDLCKTKGKTTIKTDGTIEAQITELTPETNYAYCVFFESLNGKERRIGTIGNLTTISFEPIFQTAYAENVRYYDFILNGNIIISTADKKYCDCYVLISERQDMENYIQKEIETINDDGTFILKIGNLFSGTEYYYKTCIKIKKTGEALFSELYSVTTKGFDEMAVDLGLSVKWASCDFGAQTPEEDGTCYAWGALIPNKKGSLDSYSYYSGGKYINIGTSISGDERYDIIKKTMSGKWRMPSFGEIEELYNSCNIDVVIGDDDLYLKFTGPNGKHILIKEHCNCYTTKLEDVAMPGYTPQPKTTEVFRWTGSLDENNHEKALVFCSVINLQATSEERYQEFPIRPVCDY